MPTQKGNILLPLISAVALIAIAAAGYFFYSTSAKAPADKQNQQRTPPVSTTQDETAAWKTYTNDKFGFMFQYPSNLEIIDNSKDAKEGAIMLGFQNHPFGLTIEKVGLTSSESYLNMPKISQKTINGISWDILHFELNSPESGGPQFVYQTVNNGYRYVVNYTEQIQTDIDQILSTFRFTN